MTANNAGQTDLRSLADALQSEYQKFQAEGLNLDLTRGKPGNEQLQLSEALDGILQGDLKCASGVDVRNYGGIDGIPEAKALFAGMIDSPADNLIIGGNSSLTLMYFSVLFAMHMGFGELGEPWMKAGKPIKFLCPVPGYDRHFSICEQFAIEMIPVAMDENGPDMEAVEAAVKADSDIRGIWCVPRFSNPSGIVYSQATVSRLAELPKIAGENFRIFWDNAYAVHTLHADAPALASITAACEAAGTQDNVYQFGSTSKITFAGAGVAFVGMSPGNKAAFNKHMGIATIGPDKLNQLRHVRFLEDQAGIEALMAKHAELLKPRFDIVLDALASELRDYGTWTNPEGGYFVSFDTRPGLAKKVVKLAAEAGVKLTPAGATWPKGEDPEDSNIRIAPSVPSLEEIRKAMAVFVCCVKLASTEQALTA